MNEERDKDGCLPGRGIPARMRLKLARFRAGCEVCGVMDWFAMKGGFHCGNCGNVFDVPVIESETEDGRGAS